MSYPHSKPETLADGVVHLAGLSLSVPASMLLMMRWAGDTPQAAAAATYAACLLFAFAASAIYHMSPLDRLRPILHRIDHAAIYFKIAGTYTPFVALIGSGFAYALLGFVWMLALLGAVAKLTIWRADARGSLALYLAMGWLAVLLLWPMAQVLPRSALALIVAGGLTYSAGAWVFSRPVFSYQIAIWHGFVLTASACFFAAIAISL